ncbi:hypothetical protein [Nitritalea halalkaliphila]|uniref:hypothetical protein n=1 Tax=Nitritalea halalkaliphila TaxID=590849 RepID=UPI001EE6417E|nr:hypothetical protein [Nitritalea halalkaliphila]
MGTAPAAGLPRPTLRPSARLLEDSLVSPVLASMLPGTEGAHLKLWHGFNTVLVWSLATLATGTGLYFVLKPSESLLQKATRFEGASPMQLVLAFGKGFLRLAKAWTTFFQNGYLRNYLLTIMVFLTVLLAWRLFEGAKLVVSTEDLTEMTLYEVIITVVMFVSIVFAVFSTSRLVAVASLG